MFHSIPPIVKAIMPSALVVLVCLSLAVVVPIDWISHQTLTAIVFVALIVLGLLSLRFKFTEIFFASLIMTLVCWLYAIFDAPNAQRFQLYFLFQVTSVTVPIGLLWASFGHRLSLRSPKLLPFYWFILAQLLTLPILFNGFWGYLPPETHHSLLLWLGGVISGDFLLGPDIASHNAFSGLATMLAFAVMFYQFVKQQRPEQVLLLGLLFSFYLITLSPENRHLVMFLLVAASSIIALGLTQAIHRLAFFDELTNVPSRRSLDYDMRSLTAPYAIGVLDIDHFKRLNDTYGHDVGDQVLKMVAKKLTMLGAAASVYRYGGEEFVILFQGKNKTWASYFAEALRGEIANSDFVIRSSHRPESVSEEKQHQLRQLNQRTHKSVQVTVSIGLADDGDAAHPLDVQKRADEQLYKAKEQGRNCTVIAP